MIIEKSDLLERLQTDERPHNANQMKFEARRRLVIGSRRYDVEATSQD